MLRDNWPVIDWREPIGLQERLEGRSSHNGEISVMSRSRFQGTEVTIVTRAFYLRTCSVSSVLSLSVLSSFFFGSVEDIQRLVTKFSINLLLKS